ncbi:MAG: radical SAM protein [Candidatus Eremiobacterota bacterium]
MLIFPPQSQPFLPHPALPLLTSVLKKKGIDVIQRDFNIEAYEDITDPERLKLSGCPGDIIESLKVAKSYLRNGEDYLIEEDYYRSVNVIDNYLYHVSCMFTDMRWSLKNYLISCYSTRSTRDIMEAVKDRKRNIFVSYFEDKIKNIGEPDILGISVAWNSQVIPAFTLAYLVKKHLPSVHICMGGSLIGHWADYLKYKKSMFSFVDSYIPFDGETGLVRLAEELKSGNLKDVPGLIYMNKKDIAVNKPELIDNLNNLPCPDFEGLPVDKYFSPQIFLPIYASRSCYWGKCAFCSHHLSASKYRSRQADIIYKEMNFLYEKYNCKNFYFVDDAMPPSVMKKLSQLIIKENKPYRWAGEIRFEKLMDRDYFNTLYRGGCRFLLFGLESFCQRILDSMNKGYKKEMIETVIREAHNAGIIIWVFFFLGFPGEKRNEAEETLEFIVNNNRHIDMVGPGTFVLTRNSSIHNKLKNFKIRAIGEDKNQDLQLSFPALMGEGIQQDEASNLLGEFQSHPAVQKFLRPFVSEPHLLFFQTSYFYK